MTRRHVAVFLLALALGGCGDDRGGSGPPSASQGGNASGATGGASGTGATAGVGGTGGVGSGGTSGCSGLRVKGSLDGTSIDTTVESGALVDSGTSGSKWAYRVLLAQGGLLSLEGSAASTPATGDSVTGTAYLATPSGSVLAGVHLVSAAASMKYMDQKQPIVLASLSRVGSCPGTAASGSLSLCVPGFSAPTTACGGHDLWVHGTVDGLAVDESYANGGHFFGGAGTSIVQIGVPDDGFAYAHDLGGPLAGFLAFPTAAPHDGEVLCAASATTQTVGDEAVLTLSSLSKAGARPGTAVSGTLELTACP